MWRVLRFVLFGIVAFIVLAGGLLFYFVYTPAPERPRLSGVVTKGVIAVGGRTRSYLTYVPHGLRNDAPLVIALHGSGETGARMRVETGYAFDRLADERGFAVVYPDGYDGYWNACNIVGDYAANTLNIDDVGFLKALASKLAGDPKRVFAMGVSRGGHMAFRLALEAPVQFRAVAAVAANVPAPGNFKCRPAGPGTASVLIMNGTADPLNPFDGGDARLFGLFLDRGPVLSSRDSVRYFADRNRSRAGTEVTLVAIAGGGHGMPQPYKRAPRLLGPTLASPNGAVVIWDFFARQKPR
jgi:polyhydroxybutyrate depolymerase